MAPDVRRSARILLLFCALVPWFAAGPARAASPSDGSPPAGDVSSPALNAQATRQLIDTLRDPARRAALIATLEDLERATPATRAGPVPANAAPGNAAAANAAPGKTGPTTAAPGAAAQPAAQPAPPAAAQPAPPAAAQPAAAKPVVALQPNSLGAQLMANGMRFADTVSTSLLLAVRGIANVPELLRWARGILRDPAALLAGAMATARVLGVLLLAFGGEALVWRLTHRFYLSLAADARHQDVTAVARDSAGVAAARDPALAADAGHLDAAADGRDRATIDRLDQAPPAARETGVTVTRPNRLIDGWLLLLRLPTILMALTVDLLPPLAFLAVATVAAGTPLAQSEAVRQALIAVVDAYVIVRILSAVARATFGAPSARLRLLPASEAAARYLMTWVRRIGAVIVCGFAITQFAALFGMDSETRMGLARLLSLFVHIMLIVMVLQSRVSVANWLSGAGEGFFATLRHRIASAWHVYAIIFIVAGWIIYVNEVRDGLGHLIRFMLWTIVVALAARVADIVLVGALDRGFSVTHDGSDRLVRIEERATHYRRPLRALLRLTITAVTAVLLLQVWGIDALDWFTQGALGGRIASSMLTLILTLGVAIAVWEAINVALQVYLDRLSREGVAVRAARLRTIVPLLRNTLLIILMVLIVLTAMSELGVNIGPLLAGASIFGVAIGFGSQKLVQDFITGIFLLVENAMQVGDNVTAGGLSGTVETLSIRTLKLRAGDGSVHLIPYSSVSTVTNANRGLGNAAVAVTVDYEEDSEHVAAVLKKIATDMRAEPAYANGMLSDLQLWGVDRVDGLTMTLAGQIVCTDGARWGVQREFNRRVKLAFQTENIRMLPPTVRITDFRHPLDVRTRQPERDRQVADASAAGE